ARRCSPSAGWAGSRPGRPPRSPGRGRRTWPGSRPTTPRSRSARSRWGSYWGGGSPAPARASRRGPRPPRGARAPRGPPPPPLPRALRARRPARARLDVPLGLPNATALVAAMAVLGALVLAAGRRRVADAAVALIAAALLTLALTGSRSGSIALAAGLVPAVWGMRSRPRAVGAPVAGVLGAVPAGVYGLTAGAITGSPLPDVAGRRAAGLALGALLLAGIVAGVLARPALVRWCERTGGRLQGRRRAGLVLAVAGAVLIVAGAAVVVT